MTRLDDSGFLENGWVRLPYRFSDSSLTSLAKLGCHKRRGQRLTNMRKLSGLLPSMFKTTLTEFGYNPAPLRAVGFNKTPEHNWSLPWHQDRVIAMTDRIDDPRYTNWSRKSGVWHCEPPARDLERMAFAYIAFDDMDQHSGGLELANGSHRQGVLQERQIDDIIKACDIICPALRHGEVLLVSALMLHRSGILTGKINRRSLRVDFAKAES